MLSSYFFQFRYVSPTFECRIIFENILKKWLSYRFRFLLKQVPIKLSFLSKHRITRTKYIFLSLSIIQNRAQIKFPLFLFLYTPTCESGRCMFEVGTDISFRLRWATACCDFYYAYANRHTTVGSVLFFLLLDAIFLLWVCKGYNWIPDV